MYVFNPAQIFSEELFVGEEVTVPASVQDDLNKLTTASHWMFALYIVAVLLLLLSVLAGLSTLCSRLGSIVTTLLSLVALVFIAAATLVAQVIFLIYSHAINDTTQELNVKATLGTTMFAFSWVATVAAAAAFFGFLFGICCSSGDRRASRYRRGEKASI